MIVSGTLSRGAAAVALATGLLAFAPSARAERFDLSPNGILNVVCPSFGINCETTPFPRTVGGLTDDQTLAGDNASNTSPVNPPSNATLIAIPEPSTWALLLIWFAGVAYAGLRRRRKERFTL